MAKLEIPTSYRRAPTAALAPSQDARDVELLAVVEEAVVEEVPVHGNQGARSSKLRWRSPQRSFSDFLEEQFLDLRSRILEEHQIYLQGEKSHFSSETKPRSSFFTATTGGTDDEVPGGADDDEELASDSLSGSLASTDFLAEVMHEVSSNLPGAISDGHEVVVASTSWQPQQQQQGPGAQKQSDSEVRGEKGVIQISSNNKNTNNNSNNNTNNTNNTTTNNNNPAPPSFNSARHVILMPASIPSEKSSYSSGRQKRPQETTRDHKGRSMSKASRGEGRKKTEFSIVPSPAFSESSAGSPKVTGPKVIRRHVTEFLDTLNQDEDPPEEVQLSSEEMRPQSLWQKLEIFLQSGRFELLISVLLFANVLFLALELQFHGAISGYHLSIYETAYPKEEDWALLNSLFIVSDYVFTGLFCIDVSVRIVVLRLKFWSVPINWLDFTVVAASLGAMVESLPISPMFLRLLRIGKLARALRMVTTTNALQTLQLLLKCLASSVDMLCWSFILLIFLQCIAGMVIANLARDFIADESNDRETRREVFIYYGTFTRTFLTMFEILFANWAPACRVLVDNISEWYSIFFLLYRCVIGFAVINVLNAVFVQQTLKAASSDEQLSFKQQQQDQVKYAEKVKKLFQSVDVSRDGMITFDEFALLVESPKLKFWMGQLELDYHDLLGLFEMLDDGDGEISMDEFVTGAGRLKGMAKTIDIWRLETKLEIMLTQLLALTSEQGVTSRPLLESERPDIDQLYKASGWSHMPVTDSKRRVSRDYSDLAAGSKD